MCKTCEVGANYKLAAILYLIYTLKIRYHYSFCWFLCMYYVDFVENAYSSDICWPLRLSLLFDQLIMDKRDSDGFFSRLVNVYVGLVIVWTYNLTDSSLIIVDYQRRFLACTFFVCNKTADQAYTHTYMVMLAYILCNWHVYNHKNINMYKRMCILVVTLCSWQCGDNRTYWR